VYIGSQIKLLQW